MNSPLAPGKFVRVRISATNVEIGQLISVDYKDNKATVETRSGFTISCRKSQIEPVMLVVCDLNGVLGSRRKKNDFLKRPDLDTFIPFLLNNFVVGVWSSCIRRNGEDIVRDCFGHHFESQLLFTYFRDECTPTPTKENPYATVKDLNRLWSEYPQSFDQSNTIIVDDSDEKCTHRFNALCPTPFDEKEISGSKIGLMELIDTLRQVNTVNSLDPLRPLMLRRSELLRELRDADEIKAEEARRQEQERIAREEAGKAQGVLTLASGSQISFSGSGAERKQHPQHPQQQQSSEKERSILSFFDTKQDQKQPSANGTQLDAAVTAATTAVDDAVAQQQQQQSKEKEPAKEKETTVVLPSPTSSPTSSSAPGKFMKLTSLSSSSSTSSSLLLNNNNNTNNNIGNGNGFDMNKLLSIVNNSTAATTTTTTSFTVSTSSLQQQQQHDMDDDKDENESESATTASSSPHHHKKHNNYHRNHNNNRRRNNNNNSNNNSASQQQQTNKPHYQRRPKKNNSSNVEA